MQIGILSDTHSHLDEKIFDYFSQCDEIWHAGDIGDAAIADRLENFKPFRAVYGNIDDAGIRQRYPEHLHFECEGLNIRITHIAGSPPRYNPAVRKSLLSNTPDVLVCGHSHILKVARDSSMNNMLFINPGAAGNHGFHRVKTIIRLTLENKQVQKMEVIELGKRGAL